jgi:beta-phosphoglucomutase
LEAAGLVSAPGRAQAVLFDFNGTLSDDEPLLCEIWRELFAVQGRPLSAEEYFSELAGLSDTEIARRWLGDDHPALREVMMERVARYRARAGDGSTVSPAMREAVRYAAERVPVGVVSGAARAEVESVLAAAGIAEAVSVVVTEEDVERGKPDPEGYVRAVRLLGGAIEPGNAVALEDSEAGVAAARAAGLRAIGVLGTMAPERLKAADGVVERVDAAFMRRLVG